MMEDLTKEEQSLVPNHADKVLLQIVKDYELRGDLDKFDIYKPKYFQHYMDIQKGWLETEKELVSTREGHIATEDELLEDMVKYHTPERFRAYYVLKYPAMVERTLQYEVQIK